VTAGQDRVVVLYSHPLLGEGLGRMLAAEPGLVVTTVSLGSLEALDAALAANPDVVVFEEGGPIGVLEVLRRSGATIVVDVDITSSTAWTLQRHALRSAPEEVLGAIRAALADRWGSDRARVQDPPSGAGLAVGPGRRREKITTLG
jgi:DNA-binding NarL/FixJ family response regulator